MKGNYVQEDSVRVEFLLPQHLRTMRVPWWSRFDSRGLVQHLLANPDTSFRVKNSSQYVVGGRWRGRLDIGLIVEVVGSKNRTELIRRLVERLQELECGAAVLSSEEADRSASWYLDQGWLIIDEIVVYTRNNCRLEGLRLPGLAVERFRREEIDEILDLERAAFPYLWWSGREDFLHYTALSEVKAFVLMAQNQIAGYVSFTQRGRQGFLDRLAVHPAQQGRGYGSHLLAFALSQLDREGARMVSLNTQVTNYRAQRLYQRFGFIRTNSIERIYGLWLKEREDLESAEP